MDMGVLIGMHLLNDFVCAVMGRPSSFSARARFSESSFHVLNKFWVSWSVSVPSGAIWKDLQQQRTMMTFPYRYIDLLRAVSVFRECERVESYLDRGIW